MRSTLTFALASGQDAYSESEPPEEAKSALSRTKSKQDSVVQEKRTSKANGKLKMQSGSRTPVGEDWELACEICQRRGINLVSLFCRRVFLTIISL